MLALHLFGGFEILEHGQPVALTTRPGQALLAYLALNPGPRRREELVGVLWPDDTEAAARANLRQVVWRIRKVVPEALLADELTLTLNPAMWVDVQHWEAHPFDLYRGELLPGFYDDWLTPAREGYVSRAGALARAELDQLARASDWRGVARHAEGWVKRLPAPEISFQYLMRAYAALGDLAAVRVVYRRCEQALKRELDVAPLAETQQLYEQLVTAPPRPRANLPTPLTSFIGRAPEVAEAQRWLGERRLVTLTGAGGAGKTRLALQIARATQAQFPGGVFWVELTSLTDAGQIAPGVAASVGGADTRGATLLVLDNCEQLIEACATFSAEWLHADAGRAILATSREALNVMGEFVVRVPPLGTPDPLWVSPDPAELQHYDAVRLFCERAPGFTLTPATAGAVMGICRRLEGLPLALELAAAQTAWLSVTQIEERLSNALLAGEQRGTHPRHRTLAAALDWSYALLTEPEQKLLTQLAAFAGGWSLADLEAVGDPGAARGVEQLARKSLVVADTAAERYRLLEPIREYARAKLQQAEWGAATYAAHARHFQQLARAADEQLRREVTPPWLHLVEAERDNLRAALTWAMAHATPDSAEFATVMGRVWLLHAAADNAQLRGRALYANALLVMAQGNVALARELLRQSLVLAEGVEDEDGMARARRELEKFDSPPDGATLPVTYQVGLNNHDIVRLKAITT